ncbi:MAG TPA: DNRLRE domain-containing protein [Gemmataceae bacterium]|nr:DNRLRE domain-containing protein [Gemmataceae bacterium]
MDRRWKGFALVGVVLAYSWISTATVRADQVVLYPSDAEGGANAVRILSGGATTNYVLQDIVSVYHRGGNDQNSLILFDLSSLPAGKKITTATLTLMHDTAIYPTGDNFEDTQVFRVAKPWVQWQVTWNRASGYRTSNGVPWDQPGGDFVGIQGLTDGSDPYADAVLGLDDNSPGIFPFPIDVTALVNEWYTGTSPNYGMLVTGLEGNGLHFHADRGDDPTLYPTLTIVYQ